MPGHPTKYGAVDAGHITSRNGHPVTAADHAALAALRESIELAVKVEGPAGGPLTREHLTEAVSYYALRYSSFPPAQLAEDHVVDLDGGAGGVVGGGVRASMGHAMGVHS